jgi:hypothetical protein
MSQQSQPLSHPRQPPQLSLHPPPQQHISKISHMMSLQPQLQVLNMVFSSRQEFFFRSKNRRFGRPENRFYRGEQPESSGLFSFALF